MSDLKKLLAEATPGPWVFEPHNLAGTEFDGEIMPFGFISTDFPSPIFVINNILDIDAAELDANARLMAAAPSLAAALLVVTRVLRDAQSTLADLTNPDEPSGSQIAAMYARCRSAEFSARAALSEISKLTGGGE